jgi:hypothetical protein
MNFELTNSPTAPKTAPKTVDHIANINVALANLPSQGRVYPEGATVSYSPYTFGEVKKVSQSRFSEEEYLDFVLSGVNTNFDPLILTLADLSYIAILRKLSSLGKADYSVKLTCPSCREESTHTFQMEDLNFEELTVDMPIVMDFEREQDTWEFHFSPLTIGDFKVLIRKNLKDDIVAMISICCRNHSFDVIWPLFSSFTLEEANELNQIDDYIYHGVTPLKLPCKCGKTVEANLEVDQVMVLPFRGDKKPVKSRVRFGLQNET